MPRPSALDPEHLEDVAQSQEMIRRVTLASADVTDHVLMSKFMIAEARDLISHVDKLLMKGAALMHSRGWPN
jgi:hypothetical protein